jgi:hypothetical protein
VIRRLERTSPFATHHLREAESSGGNLAAEARGKGLRHTESFA